MKYQSTSGFSTESEIGLLWWEERGGKGGEGGE